MDSLIGKALKAVPNDEWFTASFDKRTYNSRYKRAIANRGRQQVKKIGIAKNKNFKGAPGRSAMSRKDVAVLLSKDLSVLNARNAMALLELHFIQRNEPRGMPSFLKGHGSLMGPGALAASNLLSSELKAHNISLGARVDVLRNYQKSTITMKRIRRMFAAERMRLKRLHVCGSALRVKHVTKFCL